MKLIIDALNSPKESERLYAIQDIMDLKDETDSYAEPLIRHLMIEGSQAVRESIVYALKMMPCHTAFPVLFDLFLDSDAYIRNAAVTVFGTKETHGVAFLTSQLDHADREVRKLVLDALFQIGSREAVLAIRAGLHDPSINVRITAVEYLGQLNDLESIPDVLEMLEHEADPMLITSALETIMQIGNEASIQETIRFLDRNDDILKIHPVFLPELIKLISRCGTLENLMEIIALLNGRMTYAKDIVTAIEEARKRFPAIVAEVGIISRLINIVKDSNGIESVRYAAVELLLSEEYSDRDMLRDLGEALIGDHTMMHAAVRFLKKSDTEAGWRIIEEIKQNTKDLTLRDLCQALLTRTDN